MPPFLPRKRLRSPSPEAGPSKPTGKGKGKAKANTLLTTPRKPTLFDDLDAGTGTKRGAEHKKALLETGHHAARENTPLPIAGEGT